MIHEKKVLFLSLTLLLISCFNQEKEPVEKEQVKEIENAEWLTFEYDSAVIYLYNLDTSYMSFGRHVVQGNSLDPTVIIDESINLKESDIKQIGSIMKGESSSKDLLVANCFEPHHGVVFYKSDDIVGHISICTMCYNLNAFPEAQEHLIDVRRFEPLIKSLGMPVFKDLDELNSFKNDE